MSLAAVDPLNQGGDPGSSDHMLSESESDDEQAFIVPHRRHPPVTGDAVQHGYRWVK
jgi:hypothetical protein